MEELKQSFVATEAQLCTMRNTVLEYEKNAVNIVAASTQLTDTNNSLNEEVKRLTSLLVRRAFHSRLA